MVNERTVSADGLEKNFATNTLGTYLLTVGLIPVMSKSEDPRVVSNSHKECVMFNFLPES